MYNELLLVHQFCLLSYPLLFSAETLAINNYLGNSYKAQNPLTTTAYVTLFLNTRTTKHILPLPLRKTI